jgi:PAS domain S-box-containing protein
MGPLSIVIVDDEPDIAELMRLRLLKEAPELNIHVAESGLECLDYMKENPVDCILSDYQMPYMDGMELLVALRGRGSDVPFIFVTAQGNEEIARNAFKNGANDYFTKDLGGFAHFARIINSIGQAVRQRNAEARKREELIERKMAEEALKESESKFKKLADESVAGIWISQDWRLVYANPSMAGMIGYKAEELLGRGAWLDLVHPDDLQKTREAVAGVRPGKSVHIEVRVVKKDGSVIDIESRSAYTLYNGRPAVMGMAIDITERKRFEMELLDERNRARKCFDFARSMMVVIAPDETVMRMSSAGTGSTTSSRTATGTRRGAYSGR